MAVNEIHFGLPTGDLSRIKKYREVSLKYSRFQHSLYDYVLPLLLFGVVGAFGWAIRGTGGWGGTGGAVIAGFWWGWLMYYLAYIRGYDARWALVGIGVGIGIGGMTGYGQFLSWIRGRFAINYSEFLEINPLIGYLWLMLIGIEWGGNGAIILSWSLTHITEKKMAHRIWGWRIGAGILGGVLGYYLIYFLPHVFFPFYSPELYNSPECAIQCVRTAATLPSLGMLLGSFCGFFLVELVFVKNRLVGRLSLIIGGAFAFIFPVAANWFFMDTIIAFEWWKIWEESIGLIGGLGIGVAFLYLLRDAEKQNDGKSNPESDQKIPLLIPSCSPKTADFRAHLALTIGSLVLWLYTYIGFTASLIVLLGFDSLVLDNYYPLSRMFFIIIGTAIAGIYWFWHFIGDNKRFRRGQILYPVSNLHSRWLFYVCFIAVCGIFAIAYGQMMLFYVVFWWIILTLSLHLQNHLTANGLGVL
jgi:hypothetical protein